MVTLDLPTPAVLRGRWAAVAAICAARGRTGTCYADGERWHYDDSGGNWVELHHLGDGRVVLLGHDHEYSETYYAEAAEYFQEEETDLLAGTPDWWAPPVRQARRLEQWVGFVYGFDGTLWRRAAYDVDDGFTSVGLPALTEERTREILLAYSKEAPGREAEATCEAVDALIAADGAVDEELMTAVIGTGGWDPAAGVAAARAFREGGRNGVAP